MVLRHTGEIRNHIYKLMLVIVRVNYYMNMECVCSYNMSIRVCGQSFSQGWLCNTITHLLMQYK